MEGKEEKILLYSLPPKAIIGVNRLPGKQDLGHG